MILFFMNMQKCRKTSKNETIMWFVGKTAIESSLNKLLDKITCKDVFAAAESDDPLAKKIVVS